MLSRLDGERKKEILNKAAYYFLKIGESEQAVLSGMKAMAYTVVEIAVEKEAVKLAQEGRQATVSQWIHFLEPVSERLGEPVPVRNKPVLSSVRRGRESGRIPAPCG